ncbi:hypothetical protein Chor_004666 [Crotalus horridus]
MAAKGTSGASNDPRMNQLQTPGNKDEERHQLDAEVEPNKEGKMGKETWGERIKKMKTFIWNPETRECLGRTARSWRVTIRPYINQAYNIAFRTSQPSSWQPYVDNLELLLKENKTRIIGYEPGYGTPITVSCKVQKGNQSHLQSLDFFPSAAFDPMYFPYYGKLTHVNYTQPLVAIHFTGITRNQTVDIQCQLNGKGIINTVNNDRFLGRIIFTLTINS